ncbi:MAG: ribonuclease R [Gemmatimonadota bacterium]
MTGSDPTGSPKEAAPARGSAVEPEEILRYLRKKAQHPLKARELAKRLGAEAPGAYGPFRELLDELEADGLVYRQRKGRYAVPENLNLVVGRVDVTRAGDGFVAGGPDREDLFVPAARLRGAVEGDTVVARVERRPRGRNAEGTVIRVLRRAWRQVVGTYRRRRNYGFVAAGEPPLGVEFFIPPDLEADARDGQVVLVEVTEWGEGEASPVGRVVRVLGDPDEPGVDVLSILLGRQLPLEFPADVSGEAERIGRRGIRSRELEEREDLRDRLTFTIDPADARDHDDALSVKILENGWLEIGVHIANVGFYVERGGALDAEALERGTSVYLVDRVVPMLPHALSSGLCSLVPDEDRLTLSILFRVSLRGKVDSFRLVRSVVRSRHRLSYDEAQEILDGEGGGSEELAVALAHLCSVSRELRRQRAARGSIDFDLPESRVLLNAAGEPTDIQRVLRLESHLLIEDFMILANETVARLALRERLPFLFRVHEEPDPEKLEQLRALAETFGQTLPRRKVRPTDLARLVERAEGTPQEQLLTIATLRSMKQARYGTSNLGHFGLASQAYSHFTSPIRRYPDLVVHRQLARWLTDGAAACRGVDRSRLEEIARHCSRRERLAMAAERDSVELKKIEFMERHLGDEFQGTISGVAAFGLFVLLDAYHVEGRVHVSTLEDDYYVFLEAQHALVGRRRRRRFQLGDPVRVQVARVDREERRIDFELLPRHG